MVELPLLSPKVFGSEEAAGVAKAGNEGFVDAAGTGAVVDAPNDKPLNGFPPAAGVVAKDIFEKGLLAAEVVDDCSAAENLQWMFGSEEEQMGEKPQHGNNLFGFPLGEFHPYRQTYFLPRRIPLV